ncbi:GntR family transcriptional regulator [Desulfatirhabdium butyrativorans]|uniref:GntR family transcriptional regulator n=1 Tax=Desulfatirhabdium butyrativorans TaxID=340467 RepID=UPI000407FA0C|nr:GntR family transcriptional regulator [Desulfatirhabdium butyrativorans]
MTINIYDTIKQRILHLEYKPSQILNEKDIAEEFGISRTPVREALKHLEWDQLVRVLPRSGTMVSEIEFETMMYTFQVRFEIEELVGNLAAEHLNEEHLGQFEILRQRCQSLIEDKDRQKLTEIDHSFRNILFEAAHNPILRQISDHLYNLTFRLWYITLPRGKWSEEVQAMVDEIDATQNACRNGEQSKIGSIRKEILMRHFNRIREKFLGMTSAVTG